MLDLYLQKLLLLTLKEKIQNQINQKKVIYQDQKNILIFDLGGGTFDVSILELHNKILTDKGKYEDQYFGCEDFDNALVYYNIKKFYEMKTIKIDKNNDPEPIRRLKMSYEYEKNFFQIKK